MFQLNLPPCLNQDIPKKKEKVKLLSGDKAFCIKENKITPVAITSGAPLETWRWLSALTQGLQSPFIPQLFSRSPNTSQQDHQAGPLYRWNTRRHLHRHLAGLKQQLHAGLLHPGDKQEHCWGSTHSCKHTQCHWQTHTASHSLITEHSQIITVVCLDK